MCRRNRFLGGLLISFGFGLFLGSVIGAGFWCSCLAFSAAALGIAVIKAI
jgi:hypothetical protein